MWQEIYKLLIFDSAVMSSTIVQVSFLQWEFKSLEWMQ